MSNFMFRYAWNNFNEVDFVTTAPWVEEALRQVDCLLYGYRHYCHEYTFSGDEEWEKYVEAMIDSYYNEAYDLFTAIWPLLAVAEEEEEEEPAAAMDEGPGSMAHNRACRF